MQKLFSCLLAIAVVIIMFPLNAATQDKKDEKAFTYGGVATCKACHSSKKSGAQYKLWTAGPHAKAYETLKSDKAKEFAKSAGVEDASKSEKCLKCHVTAYDVDAKLKGKKFTNEEGVGCESCHGPGSAYKKLKVKKDIAAGTVDGAEFGLVTPDEKVCVTCHNEESPTFTEFKFADKEAKIAHPKPETK